MGSADNKELQMDRTAKILITIMVLSGVISTILHIWYWSL